MLKEIAAIIAIALAVTVLACLDAARGAEAQHDYHNPADTDHWYPEACCNREDCEPVPVEAVEDLGDRWRFDYVSARFGRITLTVSKDNPIAQPSRDGDYHACTGLRRNGPVGDGEGAGERFLRCFFFPLWS